MPHDPQKLLTDIKAAGDAIQSFVADCGLEHYKTDLQLRSAVERQSIKIGEALVRPRDKHPATLARIGEHREILAFRNILVHGYDFVRDEIVWDIVKSDLPRLLTTVTQALAQEA